MHNIVIVESPAKANTIGRYLGKSYKVISSMGHVRDLPENKLGVDIENNFEPQFIVKDRKLISKLEKETHNAESIYLATDNDREGEAIAYDLYEVLNHNDGNKYLRVIFNEITKNVILSAISEPREIDLKKVEAQRARRILDRLVGYLVSPLLSKSLSGSKYEGLSAGRVQSVALRFICDRELEIQDFVAEEYWTIEVELEDDTAFKVELGRYRGKKLKIKSSEEVERIKEELKGKEFVVKAAVEKEKKRSPLPPFITSSLQQTASSLLGFSPKKTMMLAQQLYEGIELEEGSEGLITYMRTDSTRVAKEAQQDLREFIKAECGEKYLSPKVRNFKSKKSQDAHEAIRPTSIVRTPTLMKKFLTRDQHKVYKLIWERFAATQVADALYKRRELLIEAGDYLFKTSGSALLFDGFLKILKLQPLKDEGVKVPELKEGDRLELIEFITTSHLTEPPNRFSEAGVVRVLEEKGIGRPSTYAAIVSTIQERGYVHKEKGTLRPTLLGFIATDFLREFFPLVAQEEFTARMEEKLDRVGEGELSRLEVLREFYAPLEQRLNKVKDLFLNGKSPFRILTDVECELCGAPMEVRYWKKSRYLGCSNYPDCKSTINFPVGTPWRYEKSRVILGESLKEGGDKEAETGVSCPECGAAMQIRQSRYGRFYGCTRYPNCKTTLPLYVGVSCPLCGSELIERFSKKRKRVFYGCSSYPDCNFIVNEKPVKLCPDCGKGVLVERDEALVCSNRSCRYCQERKG